MIPTTTSNQKRYSSAKERFLKPALIKFVEREFPKIGGPLVINLFVEKFLEKIDEIAPLKERVLPGQLVWNALDKYTRAGSPRRKTKSVILNLITEDEIKTLEAGATTSQIMPARIARMCQEAFSQETLLSMRDICLILCHEIGNISRHRIRYEQKYNIVLPHTGSLHDQGTTLTHKAIICKKVKGEKKDPAMVARETNHSQKAVDIYLRDYERVKTLKAMDKSTMEVSFLAGMSNRLVKQYENLITELG